MSPPMRTCGSTPTVRIRPILGGWLGRARAALSETTAPAAAKSSTGRTATADGSVDDRLGSAELEAEITALLGSVGHQRRSGAA